MKTVSLSGPDEYYSSMGLYEEKPAAAVCAVACFLYDAIVYNKSASTFYLLIFDQAASPVAGDHPACAPIPVTAGQTGGYSTTAGKLMKNGLQVAVSTTPDVYTSGVSTNALFEVNFRRKP